MKLKVPPSPIGIEDLGYKDMIAISKWVRECVKSQRVGICKATDILFEKCIFRKPLLKDEEYTEMIHYFVTLI